MHTSRSGQNLTSVCQTDLNIPGRISGKVRDTYPLQAGMVAHPAILLIATDRLSAFDVVLPSPIPGKGKILTEIASFWFRMIEQNGICATHLLSTDPSILPESAFQGSSTTRADLEGRTMIGRRCRVIPIECIVRGYLEGSGWKDYQATGSVCGVDLPKGLRQCDKLPEPIFTPATKAEHGDHDENISFRQAVTIADEKTISRLRDLSVSIYALACRHAESRGIIIADTKFEFGIPVDESGAPLGDDPMLIDEALTPDSSRFWPCDEYEPGHAQQSFDKQFVREYLETLVDRGVWDKTAPGPELPEDVITRTLEKYRLACDLLVKA